MKISTDVYSIGLLRDEMTVNEIIRDSSVSYLEKLEAYGLIAIHRSGKVYLTSKGQLAKKIGMERFLELEKLEEEMGQIEPGQEKRENRLFFVLLFVLQLILFSVLAYVIYMAVKII